MHPRVEDLRPHFQSFDLQNLFVEGLGWNHHHGQPVHLTVDGYGYALQPMAEKAGFVVYLCEPDADGAVPPYPVRRKIEHQIAKLSFEHIIVFVDDAKTTLWQWVKREVGKPVACREHPFRAGQGGDPLLQRLCTLAVTLDEEEGLTIGVVASRVRQAMDVERLTKRFYERFKKELATFQRFIDGIAAQGDREWYASLMLNRMMFIYFVQKKGFLDGDPDYLRNRLAMVQRPQRENGNGRFHQFYRLFLRRLFHEGLGQPEAERAPDLAALLGKVPFLNGGLFEVHDLEHDNPEISIPDEAFEKVFAFFDGYRWHLDERPNREDNEINPDVLGYIFEKYVNQKQMGAYYTKEDITGYISRNTVIPFLFDAARKQCPLAFQRSGGIWRLLQDDPDRYIYPAVGHGIAWKYSPDADPKRQEQANELPDEIAAGVDDVSLRDGWNKPAHDAYALPTETWREVVARRQRYADVRAKLASGAVDDVNDLVTLNLDIERFAMDVIVQSEGPVLLRAFWHAIRDVSVLDPTCGSGAFLFAALNILEPLYSACLEGMRGFLDDLDRTQRPHHPRALQDFRDVIAQANRHPSVRYFILKSIVLNNLYGVDIMEEAVEICKLRLFLKLVAQLEHYDQIEPLPDIDFNIRGGNTLVGFTSLNDVRRAMTIDSDGQIPMTYYTDQESLNRIDESAEIASRAFDQFRNQQTLLGGSVTAADKAQLRRRLEDLESELSRHLAALYHIDPQDEDAFAAWRKVHQPFHWFVEFYSIMKRGGFDVIIGNPPYVIYPSKNVPYMLEGIGYRTLSTKNLYCLVFERSISLARSVSPVSLIVQLTSLSSERLRPLQKLLIDRGSLHASSFPRRPQSVFEGVEMPVSILVSTPASVRRTFTTNVLRFYAAENPFFIDRLSYCEHDVVVDSHRIARFGKEIDTNIFRRISFFRLFLESLRSKSSNWTVYYQEACRYWTKASDRRPYFKKNGAETVPSHWRRIPMISEDAAVFTTCILNSSLFYWYYSAFSDCEHINDGLVRRFPIPPEWSKSGYNWQELCSGLMSSVNANTTRKSLLTKQGHIVEYDELYGASSKELIDLIDEAIANIYGFSRAEFDYIVNYDVKYRMGETSRPTGKVQ